VRYGGNGYAIGEIRRVLLHELGHAIGLDHPDQHGQRVSAVMNSIMGNVELPTTDDISGAQSMYGTPSGGTSPTPTPPVTTTVSVSASPTVVSASAGGTTTYIVSTSIVNPTAAVTVNYTMGGRAVLGKNYVLSGSPGQVTIPAGASSANVTLTAVSVRRRPKVVNMILISGSGYNVSFPNSASVTIMK
jgi:hypothetical protein